MASTSIKVALRLVISITFFLNFSFFSNASHVAGGEITFSCIGPNQYQVNLTFYRDCNGIASSASEVINYRSAACGVNASLTLNLQSTVDITPLCPSAASACGGGGTLGIQKIVYSGVLTLPSGCSNWILSYQVCCRNASITNVTGPDTNDFYTQTRLNNTVTPCNSSPVFANNPQLFACVGQPINYQQLATDPDGDVLVYSLVNALNASGSNVTYAGGFNGANPFTVPAVINPATGNITFTPNVTQVAVVAVLVQEYRGGVLIGSVMRDIQFNIVNCTNTIPTVGGINGVPGVFSISACAGSPFCFTVNASDVDAGQTVTMTASNNILGSTFTQTGPANSKTGTFCWTPTASNVGTYYITINAADNACPLIGQNSQTYTITVIANPHVVDAGPNVTICEGSSTVLNGVVGLTPPTTTYLWSPAASLATPTTTSTTATPASTTTYTFAAAYADGCIATDAVTVSIAADPIASISPTSASVCAGANFMLTGSTDVTGMNYQWFSPTMVSLGSGAFVGTQNSLVVTVPVLAGSYVYTFRVTNPVTGCTSQVTTTLIVGSPPALASCVNIYASTTGLVGNPGTQAAPTTLANALTLAACNNAVIKLATGTYNINAPLNLSSFVTIEGGFIEASSWTKTSLAGATTINRTNVLPEGALNAQRLVAFYGNSATNFRLQDLTITTAAGTAGTGMSTYGIHLTNCSNYNIVRTQVLPGAAGSGNGDNNPATYNSTWDGGAGANAANGITGNGPGCSFGSDGETNGSNGGGAGVGGANALSIGGNAGAGAAGGRGGNGRNDSSNAPGDVGANGITAAGGAAGGAGGIGGIKDGNNADTPYGGFGVTGTIGASGVNGTVGTSAHVAGFFIPGAGTNGTSSNGGGGGGGGGGAGRDDSGIDAAGGGGSGGGGGAGGGGAARGAFGGGSSFGIYLFNNGTGGNLIQDRILAGAAGSAGLGGLGGLGGIGGSSNLGSGCSNGDSDGNRGGRGGNGGNGGAGGNGGNGSAGLSNAIHLNGGTALATSDAAFNLPGQPTITVTNVNCTNTNVSYTSSVLGAWDFDIATNNAVPATAGAISPAVTQYSVIDRYSLSVGANTYTGFHNISFDGSTGSQIVTNAPQIGVDTYQVCQGDFATFNSVYPATSYVWNFNGAAANPGNVQNTNTQFNTPGFYTISLQVVTDCCGTSPLKSVLLYVVRNPTATGSGAVAICNGGSTTLTLSGLNASDVVTWSPLTAITASTANTITVNPTVTTTYIATVTGSVTNGGTTVYGCPRTITFPVTVNSLPTIAMSNTSVICLNDGAATATVSSPGLYNFIWSNGSTTFNSTSSTINSIASGLYTVTISNTGTSCSTTGSTMVFPSPTQPSIYLQSNTPTCTGIANGSAVVNVSGGTAIYTYLWNGVTPINSPNSITQTNLLPGNYTVSVMDNNGCASNLVVNIPALTLPTYNVTTNSGVCAGNDAIFSISGSDGASLTYNIGAGNTTILLDDNAQDVTIPNAVASQTMTLSAINGNCLIPLAVSIPLTVDPCGLAIKLTSFTGNCENNTRRFNWVTATEENNDFFTLEHSLNGEVFIPIETVQAAGNSNVTTSYSTTVYESNDQNVYYRLRQTDFDGNYSFSPIIYVGCTDANGNVLYPNPATIQLNLHVEDGSAGEYSLEIYDLLGKEVKTFNYMKALNADISMEISELVNGNYLLKVKNTLTKEELPVMKFVVLR